MAESPSKRRRLSSNAYVATNGASEAVSADVNDPTTPTRRRASYLSPTKASLSRSHPNVLAKSPKRGSMTEPRGRLLRQELLGSRESVISATTKPVQKTQESGLMGPPRSTPSSERDGFATAIAQAFQTTPKEKGLRSRSPLRDRQPPNTIAGSPSLELRKVTNIGDLPTPRLVRRPELMTRQPSETRNEPELPPTPVQLGIGMIPDRPRGLASSSSIGSRSGSGKHRRRVRGGGRSTITSSPLKPKDKRPVSPVDFSDVEEAEDQAIEEAPESDTEGVDTVRPRAESQHSDALPPELIEKQAEFASLQAELESLRGDLASIESLAQQLQSGNEPDVNDDVLKLLDLDHRRLLGGMQDPDYHPSFLKNPAAYLKLFSPGSLQLRQETEMIQVQKRPKVLHNFTLTAPAPWPSDVLLLSFNVRVDAEDSRIEQVTKVKSSAFLEYGRLHQWIDHRLQSPLHRFDIGGVVWGVGQYFQACTTKASAFRNIDERYGRNSLKKILKVSNKDCWNEAMLCQYLYESQLIVHAGQLSESKQVLLSYEVDLSWTGDVTVRVGIVLAGINSKAQKGAKELFQRLLVADGVVGAFDAVWNLLGFDQVAQNPAPLGHQSSTVQGVGVH